MSNFETSPLSPLCTVDHPIAELVSDFLAADDAWKIDIWFLRRAETRYQDDTLPEPGALDLNQIQFDRQTVTDDNARLLSLRANYFRGFRKNEASIDLSGNLVAIDGRNSSGKTSLVEAIEWLLTGRLVRRELGDSKELADCITNSFKPDDETTWVEAKFEQSGETLRFRRELIQDYGKNSTSICVSSLLLNNEPIDESDYLLNSLFAGVAPLLMQHTLQKFVLDPPAQRRDYFESLLNLNDITELIQKAVVGEIGLERFPREGGGKSLSKWSDLIQAFADSAPNFLKNVGRGSRSEMKENLNSSLCAIASHAFGIQETSDVELTVTQVQDMQRRARQREFPLLERLRPKRRLDQEAVHRLSKDYYHDITQQLFVTQSSLQTAIKSNESITEAEKAIANSLDALRRAGLIREDEKQTCPLCNFQDYKTLSNTRIEQVSKWNVVRESLATAQKEFDSSALKVTQSFKDLVAIRRGLIPSNVRECELQAVEDTQFVDVFLEMRSTYDEANEELLQFDQVTCELIKNLVDNELGIAYRDKLPAMFKHLPKIESTARKYEQAFDSFEESLSQIVSVDPAYAARDRWLEVVENSVELVEDLKWEEALQVTQRELKSIRSSLIDYRQRKLEARRKEFSINMAEIWSLLREDRYSGFRNINIPKPRGKGFPVKIEVTARLDDGTNHRDVDALNVMSESQVNAIGIAAFITRSRLLGHRCLIMDDPVQSMDDEHYKSFANELLSYLCARGFQIILLTHSDMFARDISHYHFDREGYVTLGIAHSRRRGIKVTEGNRRVQERLKHAEDHADDGNFDRAWYFVRLAVERLYTVAYIKHGADNFDPRSWSDQTAEYMWEQGVDEIIAKFAPGSERRLREILKFTVPGAHDKAELGFTDLMKAVKFLRPLPDQLKVGG